MALGNGAIADGVLASPRHTMVVLNPAISGLSFIEYIPPVVAEIGIFSAPRRIVSTNNQARTLVVKDYARLVLI